MKFEDYLTEKQGLMTAIKMVYRDCQPYLKEMRKNRAKHFFYRGTRLRGDVISEITPRQDRIPKDTPQGIQDYLDNYFQKKFHWRPRGQGVFTSYRRTEAIAYGDSHMFFPIGKYDYIFNPDVQDLWGYIDDNNLVSFIEDEPDYDMYSNEYDYYNEYGEDTPNGSWYYEGTDTGESNKKEAVNVAAEAEGIDIEDEDAYYDVEYRLDWVPEMTLEDYAEEKWNEEKERRIDELEGVLDNYIQSKNLKKAMDDGYGTPEIIWKCKRYYIVPSKDYEDFFVDSFLSSNNKDFLNTIERVDKQMLLPFKWSKK